MKTFFLCYISYEVLSTPILDPFLSILAVYNIFLGLLCKVLLESLLSSKSLTEISRDDDPPPHPSRFSSKEKSENLFQVKELYL